jgi:hypothetical protein
VIAVINYIVEPSHCNQCLKEVTVNKDGSLRVQNIKIKAMLSDIHTIRIYCEKHDYLIGMIPIVKLHRGKKVKSSGRQNKL